MLDESREAIVAITWQCPASSVHCLFHVPIAPFHVPYFQRSSWGERDDSSRDFSEFPSPQSAPSVQGRMLSKNTSLLGRIFIIILLVHVGCILGNYYGKADEKVLIPGKTQLEIKL